MPEHVTDRYRAVGTRTAARAQVPGSAQMSSSPAWGIFAPIQVHSTDRVRADVLRTEWSPGHGGRTHVKESPGNSGRFKMWRFKMWKPGEIGLVGSER